MSFGMVTIALEDFDELYKRLAKYKSVGEKLNGKALNSFECQ